MFRYTSASVLICLASICSPAFGDDSLAELVTRKVQPRIEKGETIGIVVGIAREGRTEVFGFGRPWRGAPNRPDGRTVFEIGSVSKVFTAVALADMAEAGMVSLDAPLRTLLPDDVKVPSRGGHEITLRMLANHSSGLPRLIPKVIARTVMGKAPYAEVGLDDLYEFIRGHKLAHDPGTRYDYSNLGAGLLGTALSRRAGASYEELILSRICEPLDMRDTRINLDESRRLRLARPYTSHGAEAKPWVFDAFAGAGALRSTADDMLRFVRANLGLVEAPGTLRAAFDSAMKPRTPADSAGISMALGWHVFDPKAKPACPEILWHNGGTGGFRSFIGLARSKKVGVVVLSNSDASVDEIGIALIEHLAQE